MNLFCYEFIALIYGNIICLIELNCQRVDCEIGAYFFTNRYIFVSYFRSITHFFFLRLTKSLVFLLYASLLAPLLKFLTL